MTEDYPVVTVKITFADIELSPEIIMCLYGFYVLCITSIIYMYYKILDRIIKRIVQYQYKRVNTIEYRPLDDE